MTVVGGVITTLCGAGSTAVVVLKVKHHHSILECNDPTRTVTYQRLTAQFSLFLICRDQTRNRVLQRRAPRLVGDRKPIVRTADARSFEDFRARQHLRAPVFGTRPLHNEDPCVVFGHKPQDRVLYPPIDWWSASRYAKCRERFF